MFLNGAVRCLQDNWPTIEPYFNETGSNCPSILPMEQQKALCQLAVQAVKALGFTLGAFHVEGKYTSHGPHIIEVRRAPAAALCSFLRRTQLRRKRSNSQSRAS